MLKEGIVPHVVVVVVVLRKFVRSIAVALQATATDMNVQTTITRVESAAQTGTTHPEQGDIIVEGATLDRLVKRFMRTTAENIGPVMTGDHEMRMRSTKALSQRACARAS